MKAVKISPQFDRFVAPENDDVIIASGVVRKNGTLFWAMRTAAMLAAAVRTGDQSMVLVQNERMLQHLTILGVVI